MTGGAGSRQKAARVQSPPALFEADGLCPLKSREACFDRQTRSRVAKEGESSDIRHRCVRIDRETPVVTRERNATPAETECEQPAQNDASGPPKREMSKHAVQRHSFRYVQKTP